MNHLTRPSGTLSALRKVSGVGTSVRLRLRKITGLEIYLAFTTKIMTVFTNTLLSPARKRSTVGHLKSFSLLIASKGRLS